MWIFFKVLYHRRFWEASPWLSKYPTRQSKNLEEWGVAKLRDKREGEP